MIKKKEREKDINKKTIYFDNNGTTIISSRSSKAVAKWQACYNASSDAKVAKSAKDLLKTARNYIHKHCDTGGDDKYVVLFTSGATESNCTIIKMIVDAYHRNIYETPHVVTSEYEHHSTLSCLQDLEDNNRVTVTYIKPSICGIISPKLIEKAIKKNTCLVTIMWANNEIGTCNNIREIARITHNASTKKFRIPFHTDAVQMFGKYKFSMYGDSSKISNKKGMGDIDSLSMSFHKLYGPKNIGLLLIKKNIVSGFDLKALITGSQQFGLRGGTENIPGIAGAIEALKHTFQNRTKKNNYLKKLKELLLSLLSEHFVIIDYKDYIINLKLLLKDTAVQGGNFESKISAANRNIESKLSAKSGFEKSSFTFDSKFLSEEPCVKTFKEKSSKYKLVLLGHPDYNKKVLPNTILISIIKKKGKPFCNVKFKKKLGRENVVVSISSTCLTDKEESSHVMEAISAPKEIRNGVIRISLGDNNTKAEVKKFVSIFKKILLNSGSKKKMNL